MSKAEKAIVTVLCMIYDGDKILLQDRASKTFYYSCNKSGLFP